MKQALAYFSQANYPEAAAILSRLIAALGPQDRELLNDALTARSKVYLVLGQPGLALADIDRIQLEPRESNKIGELYLLKGVSQLQLKLYQDAIFSFNTAERLIPQNAGLYSNRAVAYQSLGKMDLAKKDLQKSISIQPAISTYFNLGVLAKDAGDYRTCYDILSQIVERQPSYYQVFIQRGICAGFLGLHDQSIADMLRALKADPSNPEALERLGLSLAAKGEYEGARKYLEKAASLRLASGQVEDYQRILKYMSNFGKR